MPGISFGITPDFSSYELYDLVDKRTRNSCVLGMVILTSLALHK